MIKAKRFWKAVEVAPQRNAHEWGVTLDGRPLKTPQKDLLHLPNRALAEAVAEEWRALPEGEEINPALLPITRMANLVCDKLPGARSDIIEMLADYTMTDLLCYRAAAPEALVEAQRAAWDGYLERFAQKSGAPLRVNIGIMPIAQPAGARDYAARRMEALSDFELAAFHELVTILGSMVLALAILDDECPADAAFEHANLDEIHQEEQWGADSQAKDARAARYRAFKTADLCRELGRKGNESALF